MSWWKHDYVYFQNKFLIILSIVLASGQSYALSQDWPCADFLLDEYKVEQINGRNLHYYQETYNQYKIKIVLTEQEEHPYRLDDCGTAGCPGTIYNLETNAEELLNFYCEETDVNQLNHIKCRIKHDSEYLFIPKNDNTYQSIQCVDEPQNFYQLDIRQCEDCVCKIKYFKDNLKQENELILNCAKDYYGKIRCFSLESYLLKFFPDVSLQDFNNCVRLEM